MGLQNIQIRDEDSKQKGKSGKYYKQMSNRKARRVKQDEVPNVKDRQGWVY